MSSARVHPPMPYAEYAALPGVRSSRLRLMDRSPLHYREAPDVDTSGRGMLRAVHALAIEGADAVERDFVVYEGHRRGKAYDAFVAANPGRTILNVREAELVASIARAYLRHAVAGRVIAEAEGREESITWTHPATGLPCKARLDLRRGPTIADLKTYGTSSPRQIANRAAALGAHIQAAHYVEGAAIALGIPEREFRYLLLCAESAPPWDVAVVELEQDNALALGRTKREELMRRIAECESSGAWPGAAPETVALELPVWADPLAELPDSVNFPEDNEHAA